jgi:hypothetical protein
MTAEQKRKVKAVRDLIGKPPINLVALSLFLSVSALAGDDRLGFSIHVNQQDGDAVKVMPLIAQTGVGWVRQDFSISAIETTKGVYSMPASVQYWIDAVAANNLKLLVTLLPLPGFYSDLYDPVAMANSAAWLAQHEGSKIAAIAVLNEPNNAYAAYKGANWEADLVALTNGVRAAVHAASPATKVIGLGAQGDQILNMLAIGGQPDGVDYHPYTNPDNYPEGVYEPSYFSYSSWIAALQAKTKLPRWETEFNDGGPNGVSEYFECNWLARRLMESVGLGVAHAFIYDFTDSGNLCTVNGNGSPRQAFFLVQRYCKILSGVIASTDKAVVTSPDPNFPFSELFSFVFQGWNKTVCSLWFSEPNPVTYSTDSVSHLATVSFPVPHGFTNPQIVNSVTGESKSVFSFPWTHNNGVLMVYNVPVSSIPQILVIQ